MFLVLLTLLILAAFPPWLLLWIYCTQLRASNKARRAKILKSLGADGPKQLVGFFHPYCNAGGGGERVLWGAIASLQQKEPSVVSIVYTGDIDASKDEIITKVQARFDIALDPKTMHFVFLRSRYLVEDSTWRWFTLLGQSIGSMYLVWEATTLLIPDLFIDTMGYAFTYPVVILLGRIPVGAYVHYPTISTDMLSRVRDRRNTHTNSNLISQSAILSKGKLLYYRFFVYYYSLSLRTASFLMANGTWTKDHVDSIVLRHSDSFLDLLHLLSPPLFVLKWYFFPAGEAAHKETKIVYPPCPTSSLASLPLDGREKVVLSIAQFRPEKEHKVQLLAFTELLHTYPEHGDARLVLIGGSRNDEDAKRVEELKSLAKELEIDARTTFLVNASYSDMLAWLGRASLGISTMVDEHFGINVVEFMAAGVIPVAHASGGPLKDIVVPFDGGITGYHATDPRSFADAMHDAFTAAVDPKEGEAMRRRARMSAVKKFSDEEFVRTWEDALGPGGWKTWLR